MTEREAARLLPLLATASAVHNFCRRSVTIYIIHQNIEKSALWVKHSNEVFL